MILGKPWSCVFDAFCLATGINADDLIESVGHDGSEIIDKSYPEPYCRRAFSTDELVLACLQRNWTSTALPVKLSLASHMRTTPLELGRNLAKEYLDMNPYGCYVICTYNHAFAYKNQQILDPAGRIKSLPDWSLLYLVYSLHKLV